MRSAEIFFLIGGLFFVGVSIVMFVMYKHLVKGHTEHGEGTVIGFLEGQDADGESSYRPQVQIDHEVGPVTITGRIGASSPAYRVGRKIAVRYPPGRPGLAVINRERRMFYLAQAFFLTSGAIAIVVALWSIAGR